TGRRALTKPSRTSSDFDPAWSPNGRRIAYVHSTGSTVGPGQSGTEIWVMNANGSGKRRLTRNVSFDGGPTWSPDGRRIMFARGSLYTNGSGLPHSDLWVMNANGSGQRRLTRTRELELEPSWSPRGDRIAFLVAPPVRVCTASNACTLGRERDLWTSAPDGTRRATGGIGGDLLPSAPTWSPDGQRLPPSASGSPPERASGSSASRWTARTRASSAAATSPRGRPTGRRSSSPTS